MLSGAKEVYALMQVHANTKPELSSSVANMKTKMQELETFLEKANVGLAQGSVLNTDRRVKPKMHLFLELCIEGGKPATCWTYRDEDWGGSVAKMSRRRGGLLSTAAYSSNLLDRFRMQQPMIRMRR